MFGKFSESLAHRIRWILTVSWLLLIASLFFDPITAWLTLPERTFSPFRLDPSVCVQVQGQCIEEAPYAIGAALFWGAIVPISIFILLVFGHELWRRICPLSFLSQLPRAFNSQRRMKRTDKRGQVRYELAKVDQNSWLARNHLYLQLGLFFAGLCLRILFVNSDRTLLGLFLLGTIVCAIGVGYYYGGKSWCNYFCPMSPVQRIYAEPGGLFTSPAHTAAGGITQSMCRTIDPQGNEQSACVACQTPCIDIDSERSYWETVTQPDRKVLYYGYMGLMVGYFAYYYLYAGNWTYYMSGAWAHQEDQLATLLDPGFYLFHQPIPIPKLVAVPMTLGLAAVASISIGRWIEKTYQSITDIIHPLDREILQHHIFTLYTYVCFNVFFIFGGRSFINLLPASAVHVYEAIVVVLSTTWLLKTLRRNPDRYLRERLSNRFRKQLVKLDLDVEKLLDRRSLDDLSTDEVYVLAKVLPEFTQEKRLIAYKGVLRETVAEGHFDSNRSQVMLAQIRHQLGIGDREHRAALAELGLDRADWHLDAPDRSKVADLKRAIGYRQALSRVHRVQQRQFRNAASSQTQLNPNDQFYAVTARELKRLERCSSSNEDGWKKVGILLQQLYILSQRYRFLDRPLLKKHQAAVDLLKAALEQKERRVVTGLFQQLAVVPTGTPQFASIARTLAGLAPQVVRDVLSQQLPALRQKLHPQLLSNRSEIGA